MNFVIFLIVGAIAGWLAGTIMKGSGFGLIGNIIVGVIGGFVGGWLFDLLEISIGGEVIGAIITSLVGAIALLFVIGLIRKN